MLAHLMFSFVLVQVEQQGRAACGLDTKYFLHEEEVELLIGDASKAKEKLGWEPSYTVQELVNEMVSSDLELFRKDILLKEGGFKIVRPTES